MKIAIVTLTRNLNHGNILQNMALSQYLRKYNIETETIINLDGSKLFKKHISIKQLVKIIINKNGAKFEERKRKKFLRCCKANICYSHYFFENGKIDGAVVDLYDFFVVGSDQVWNPYFKFGTDFEFLSFSRPEQRITYAASFGVSNLDGLNGAITEKYAKYLSEFSNVSLREDVGVDIVKKLCDIPCSVHIDPTMLLTAEEWRVLYYKPKMNLPQNYIVVYILGALTKEYEQALSKIAKSLSAEVINVANDKYFTMDPLEFIWLIDHSKFVCTDSFHGTVFSILFNKSFYVFNRIDNFKNQSSRLETLLNKFSLNDRIYKVGETYQLEMNYSNIEYILIQERVISKKYLCEALKIS